MVNYNQIFLEKTGQMDIISPWDNTRIEGMLNNAAYLATFDYATPWADFSTTPDKYKYAISIFAAIQYWWAKAGEYASKFDMQVGGNANQKSTQLFYRALEMIDYLTKDLEKYSKDMFDTGSAGDVLVGQLIKRSKFSGDLVPYSTDPAGDWTS